jgi:hypothetical protein
MNQALYAHMNNKKIKIFKNEKKKKKKGNSILVTGDRTVPEPASRPRDLKTSLCRLHGDMIKEKRGRVLKEEVREKAFNTKGQVINAIRQ